MDVRRVEWREKPVWRSFESEKPRCEVVLVAVQEGPEDLLWPVQSLLLRIAYCDANGRLDYGLEDAPGIPRWWMRLPLTPEGA